MADEVFSKLSANLRGSVITPVSGEYETARKVYNGMIDRRPDAIVRCAASRNSSADEVPPRVPCL